MICGDRLASRINNVFGADRMLLVEDVQDDLGPSGVAVQVNWLAELERRAPLR